MGVGLGLECHQQRIPPDHPLVEPTYRLSLDHLDHTTASPLPLSLPLLVPVLPIDLIPIDLVPITVVYVDRREGGRKKKPSRTSGPFRSFVRSLLGGPPRLLQIAAHPAWHSFILPRCPIYLSLSRARPCWTPALLLLILPLSPASSSGLLLVREVMSPV